MREFEWDADDDLQLAEIDREHKLLDGLMELFYTRSRAGAGHRELMDLLRELEARTRDHFRNEELYLASIDYSGLEPHRRVHRQLLDQLARHLCAYGHSGGSPPDRLLAFLRDWLSAHLSNNHLKHRGFAVMKRRGETVG